MKNEKLSKLFNNNIFWAVISLVAALGIWVYMTGTQTEPIEKTLYGVQVAILGEEELQATGPYESACAYAFNMEITAPGVDKGEALKVLCSKLGIDASEVMAFGDADNDLGMLSWAGWSFAMGNGTDKAKAAAKYVTGRNSDSGVAQGVEQYALGQQ